MSESNPQAPNLAILENPNFKDKGLLADLAVLFEGRVDAINFIKAYGDYIETIDDLVDEPPSAERVATATGQAATVFNLPYWKQWGNALYCVERLIHNDYFDSVRWEHAPEEWKRRDAKCLSHSGYHMLFAIILLEFGEDTLKRFSLRFRAHAHERHLQDPI